MKITVEEIRQSECYPELKTYTVIKKEKGVISIIGTAKTKGECWRYITKQRNWQNYGIYSSVHR